MTDEQRIICHGIIHTHAVASGAGNLVPVPGIGIAVDTVTMTTMTVALAAVFGGSMQKSVAEGIAVQAIKETMIRQPMKVIAKEFSKLIPFAGQAFSSAVSVGLMEAAGWYIAEQLDRDSTKMIEHKK